MPTVVTLPRRCIVLLAGLFVTAQVALATQPQVVHDNLQMPAAWKACAADEQCVRIPNGCQDTAANVGHEKEARALSLRVVGNPATLRCQTPASPKPWSAPVCLEQACVLIQAPPTR